MSGLDWITEAELARVRERHADIEQDGLPDDDPEEDD